VATKTTATNLQRDSPWQGDFFKKEIKPILNFSLRKKLRFLSFLSTLHYTHHINSTTMNIHSNWETKIQTTQATTLLDDAAAVESKKAMTRYDPNLGERNILVGVVRLKIKVDFSVACAASTCLRCLG
jgi:hypothetical protein